MMYNITRSTQQDFTWYVIPKTGSRTLYSLLPGIEKTKYDILPEKEDLQTGFHFTMVRHPLDRLVSGWASKVKTGRLYKDYQNRPFSDFVDFVCSQPAPELDIHFRPQHLMLPPGLDFIGYYEHYKRDAKTILDRVGVIAPPDIGLRFPRLNASQRGQWRKYYSLKDLKAATGYYVNDFWELGY